MKSQNGTPFKPGSTCTVSGQYEIVWVSTGTKTGVERTVVNGKHFPPTPQTGQAFVLVDKTKTR